MRHILVTGFEPFGGDAVNPSQELAKALDGRRFGVLTVRSAILPVQHEAARDAVTPLLTEPGLEAVVQLGLANGRARIAVECVGVNVLDYRLPDAHGDVLQGVPCVPGGPTAYWSTLPVREIVETLTGAGIPAYLSYTAGTYLCNFTLYSTLHALARRGSAVRAGFIHVPFLLAMVAAHGLEEPSMDLALMLRAVETALDVIVGSGRAVSAL
jgi:pyroglutamyl-peptidase